MKPQTKTLTLLKLGGSPYEIGHHHGREGKEGIQNFLNIIINHGKEFMPDLTKEKALAQAKLYKPFIEAYAPHLAEEIKGIADGAEISLEEAYLLQVRAEFTQLTIEEVAKEGCTSFSIPKDKTDDGEVWVGQNLDLTPFYKDFGVMLHIAPKKGPVILCYSQIGSIAHAGINSAGIGWAANALFSSGWKAGVPRPVLYRLLLEKGSVSEAIKSVTEAARASSCNYLISHKSGEIKDLEVTPEDYGIIDSPQSGVMIHANHFIHPSMVPFEKRPKDKLENSRFRENRFRELVTQHRGKLSIETLKGFLADHQRYPTAVCTHAEANPWNISTIASIISIPARGMMHVALGQACRKEYVTYSI
jgi:isopenicillin-N N-acyltransferase-like protein